MTNQHALSDDEYALLDLHLAGVMGGDIPNTEALDGLFAALACCPDLVMPSEYMQVIQSGKTEANDMSFDRLEDAEIFFTLVNQHWNHVNYQLDKGDVFLPLIFENDAGEYSGNDWANGFLCGTQLRPQIWGEVFDDEEIGGALVPILALAHEHHADPDMRPYNKPIDNEQRDLLIVGAAAGVMRLHRYFLKQRSSYLTRTRTVQRKGPKTGRNEPCPCGSGKKFKKCCGQQTLLH